MSLLLLTSLLLLASVVNLLPIMFLMYLLLLMTLLCRCYAAVTRVPGVDMVSAVAGVPAAAVVLTAFEYEHLESLLWIEPLLLPPSLLL